MILPSVELFQPLICAGDEQQPHTYGAAAVLYDPQDHVHGRAPHMLLFTMKLCFGRQGSSSKMVASSGKAAIQTAEEFQGTTLRLLNPKLFGMPQ